ncbi:MAG: GNAT family N-acetyltransferase [Actinomycetota bacterium]
MRNSDTFNHVEFLTASLSQLTDISKLFHACWHVSYKNLLSDEVRTHMTLEEAANLWRPSLIEPNGRETVVGVLDSQIVSVFRIGADKDNPEGGHLFSLYVNPDKAGHGIGKKSLAEAETRLRQRSFNTMTLWVFEKNEIAKRLYRSFGFHPTGSSRVDERWKEAEVEMFKTIT